MKKGRLKSFDEGVEKNGLRVILFIRLIPLFQYDAVNFGSGLSKMKFRDYALGSLIGMAPGGFINAMLGSSLENVISVQFFAALGFFILLMFVPTIYKAVKKKKEAAAKQEKEKKKRGECRDCGEKIGPIATLVGWTNWGRFVCPGCGKRIRFRYWFLAVLVLVILLVGVERLLHFFLISPLPLWLSFLVAFVMAVLVMFIVPMIWRYEKA